MDGTGDELAGVPLLLPVLIMEGFDAREEGVTERLGSTFRFLAGGTFLPVAVAVPFLLLDAGAGRFFDTIGSVSTLSVEGIGTDDSRSGE